MDKIYDVVVAGGGPGGFSAARAAAGRGASVLLIEKYGFLGGMATAGLVNPFMRYTLNGRNLASPVFRELIEKMKAEGALDEDRRVFDDEVMKVILDRMMAECGAEVMLHSFLAGAAMDGEKIKNVFVEGKSGRISVKGKVFVDSTGDGDLARGAGCAFRQGREEDSMCQPMTLCFRIGGAEDPGGDNPLAAVREELNGIFAGAKKAGRIRQPRENVLVFRTLIPGVYHFNTTRIINKNGTNAKELTEAEIEGRRQAYELFRLFRESKMFKTAAC